jgi:hypothetical protein
VEPALNWWFEGLKVVGVGTIVSVVLFELTQRSKRKERRENRCKRFVAAFSVPPKVTGYDEARSRAAELFAELGGDRRAAYVATLAYMRYCSPFASHLDENRRLESECERVRQRLLGGIDWSDMCLDLVEAFAATARANDHTAGRKPYPWLMQPDTGSGRS